MSKKSSILLGAHMSIAGGMYLAIERGESIGCTAIQIFTKSNRQWKAKIIQEEEILLFKEKWANSFIQSIIAHATYLINIGSSDPNIVKNSIECLILELNRCVLLDIPYLVFHPGSRGTLDEKKCLTQISKNLDKVLDKCPNKKTMLLIETMAGQGSTIGHTFEQIAQIIKHSKHKKQLGVCFDTCHAFAAGYLFNSKETYKNLWKNFDNIIGLNKLKAIHINDSKMSLGSKIDRHVDIGKGQLGLDSFQLLLKDPQFKDIPKILETPKESLDDDLKNMQTLYKLIGHKE